MRHIVAHDAVERAETILHTDFLPLLVCPSRIGDPHLVDPQPQPRDLGNDLRLEAEPLLLELNQFQHLAAEDLITGLDVRELRSVNIFESSVRNWFPTECQK